MESRTESPPVSIAFCSSKVSLLVERLIFVGLGAALAFLLLSFYSSSLSPILASSPTPSTDDSIPTFYDDPSLSYTLDGGHLSDWDAKRRHWLRLHPTISSSTQEKEERVLMVSGSQPSPCRKPAGYHLLLRFYKNKADYCRIHGQDLFYHTALLHPNMTGCWAKIPLIRAAMLAHPEAEWIWWVDEDAAFTGMEFPLPLPATGTTTWLSPDGPPWSTRRRSGWASTPGFSSFATPSGASTSCGPADLRVQPLGPDTRLRDQGQDHLRL